MTLKTCLEIGKDCGLETVGECVYNIDMHSMCIFTYSEITKELKHLFEEERELYNTTSFTEDSETERVLEYLASMEND